MRGFQNVYVGDRIQVVLTLDDTNPMLQRQYRAHAQRGLDMRTLMQIAIAYSKPFIITESPLVHEEYAIASRVRNLLRETDTLKTPAFHERQIHQLLDFMAEIGPLLRFRLEQLAGWTDLCAKVEHAREQFIIVSAQCRPEEYASEFISNRGPDPKCFRWCGR